ncbi:MAG: hypothetical protein AB1656_17535 [Candidatus Omnitrophota bacterium]
MRSCKIFSFLFLASIVIGAASQAQVGVFDKSADWTLTGSGQIKVPGSAELKEGNYVVKGNGDDIWGTADEGYYIYTEKSGDQCLMGRIYWAEPGGNDWAKAEVMIREKGDLAGSKYVAAILRGASFGDQSFCAFRDAEGGASTNVQFYEPKVDPTDPNEALIAVASPGDGLWVRVTRIAELNLFYAEWSYDGKTWHVGHNIVVPMADTVGYGLAVTNHDNNNVLAECEFRDVKFTALPTLPSSGARAFSMGGFQPGSVIEVTVKVLNPNRTAAAVKVDDTIPDGWTISDVGQGGSTSGNTVTWNINAAFGYTALTYKAKAPAAPGFVNAWTGTVGSAITGGASVMTLTQDKPVGDQIFDQHADIFRNLDELGGEGLLGSAEYDAATKIYTISGAGNDIWNNYDNFHFLYTTVSGDFKMTARIHHDESERSTSTDVWIKGMLMARQNLTAGSPNFGNRVRRDGQYSWQMRTLQDGASTSDGSNRVTFSAIGYAADAYPPVMVERKGDNWTIYYQDNAGAWIQVQSTQTLKLQDPIYVGLAVTAHQVGSIQYTWFKDVTLELAKPVRVEDWTLY